jgi:uncharacterized protein (DUF58 family)
MITHRGWATLASAAAAIGLGVAVSSFLITFATLAVFVFIVTDVVVFPLTLPRSAAQHFRVERSGPPRRLSVGRVVRVRVTACYAGPRGFWGELVDEAPAGCAVQGGRTSVTRWWTPGVTVVLEYSLRVLERGVHTTGPTRLLATGPFGLCFLDREVGRPESFLALPPEPAIPRGASTRALYSRIQGQLNLRKRGFGSEIRSLRPYASSDDIRDVAWRRSTPEEILVREYDQEGRQDYLLVYDVSTAMAAGPAGGSALDIAASAGRLVAGLVERSQEDRLGVLSMAGGSVEFLAPGRGQRHLASVDERLAMLAVRAGEFDLAALFRELARSVPLRTHIFVFTALATPPVHAAGNRGRWVTSRHHLAFFTPDLVRLYQDEESDEPDWALQWARDHEVQRARARQRRLHGEGIPLFSYDGRNISSRVVSAYVQARAWGIVR